MTVKIIDVDWRGWRVRGKWCRRTFRDAPVRCDGDFGTG